MGAGIVVRYRSIEIGRDVELSSVGPSVAFLPLARPLPVGADLEVEIGDATGPVRVIRVVESVKGRDAEPGVWIRLVDGSDAVRDAWSSMATVADADIPEGIVLLTSTKPKTSSEEENGGRARKGDSTEPPEDDGRRTQVMSAVDVAAALGEDAPKEESASAAPEQPAEQPSKRRRRRRRR